MIFVAYYSAIESVYLFDGNKSVYYSLENDTTYNRGIVIETCKNINEVVNTLYIYFPRELLTFFELPDFDIFDKEEMIKNLPLELFL